MIHTRIADSNAPYYAASRLWLDAVIDPLETRGAYPGLDPGWVSKGNRSCEPESGDAGVQYGGVAEVAHTERSRSVGVPRLKSSRVRLSAASPHSSFLLARGLSDSIRHAEIVQPRIFVS